MLRNEASQKLLLELHLNVSQGNFLTLMNIIKLNIEACMDLSADLTHIFLENKDYPGMIMFLNAFHQSLGGVLYESVMKDDCNPIKKILVQAKTFKSIVKPIVVTSCNDDNLLWVLDGQPQFNTCIVNAAGHAAKSGNTNILNALSVCYDPDDLYFSQFNDAIFISAFKWGHLKQENILSFISKIDNVKIRSEILKIAQQHDPLIDADVLLARSMLPVKKIKKEILMKFNLHYYEQPTELTPQVRIWLMQGYKAHGLISDFFISVSCVLTNISNKEYVKKLMSSLHQHLFDITKDEKLQAAVSGFSLFKNEKELKKEAEMVMNKQFTNKLDLIRNL